jgi:hypothetical protein
MQEADWKVFRRLIPELRERYLRKQNAKLVALLSAPGKTETERFWDAEEAVRREAKILRDCLDNFSRSHAFESILLMRRHGLLEAADLGQFSEELREKLQAFDLVCSATPRSDGHPCPEGS